MHDLALTLLGIYSGLLGGIVLWDMRQRSTDRDAREQDRKELETAQASLAELHNGAVNQLKILSDKVAAHDLVISAGAARNPFTSR